MSKKRFVYGIIISALLASMFSATSSHAAGQSYFSSSAKRSNNLKPFPKWTGMIKRYDGQRNIPLSECGAANYQPCDAIREWKQMLGEQGGKSLKEKVEAVNEWSNSHEYIIDQINWGVEDYWETPNEFMTVYGDCEDYAISKYYSLRALGVSPDKMRIIIVQDFNLGGIIHAILSVSIDDTLYILDNQVKQVVPALDIYHYKPIFGINEDAWWFYSMPKA